MEKLRRMKRPIVLDFFLVFSLFSTAAADQVLEKDVLQTIRAELANFGIVETDLKLPRGGELPFTMNAVEKFFSKPLDLPLEAGGWLDAVESSTGLSGSAALGYEVLFGTSPLASRAFPPSRQPALPRDTPVEIQRVLHQLYVAMEKAQHLVKEAVESVPKEGRPGFLSLNEFPLEETGVIEQEISSRRIKQKYEGMKSFKEREMVQAAILLTQAIDKALPQLVAASPFDQPLSLRPVRWPTPLGPIIVKGAGDDATRADDLREAVLLIDLGGKNEYQAPVAAAQEGQIRIAIDLGTDVTVRSNPTGRGNAGSGVFGIGIMALPNPAGTKKFEADSFAQGCGIAGVGGLLIRGEANLQGIRYSQGSASFGLGILDARRGEKSSYVLTRMGQGLGLVRGVGVFSHEGNAADIRGGLVEPDPREPMGAISMCQGVGDGRRAYAGGGVGIAAVQGDSVTVTGSYFAQGTGYWHALGAFRLKGNHGRIQARRYDQGSGVHSAFGHFQLLGNDNRLINWGVGPAYGWDRAFGTAIVSGDRNQIQVEWGAGTASIGSLSSSFLRGDDNLLLVPDFGSGQFRFNEPAYSIHAIEGQGNRMRYGALRAARPEALRILPNPWGVLRIKGVELDPGLSLPPPEWPRLPQEAEMKREMVDLQARLKAATSKLPLEETADLLDVAAAFSLDKDSPRQALERLVALAPEKVPFLVEVFERAAVEQLIQLRVALAALGDEATIHLLEGVRRSSGQKAAALLGFLDAGRPSLVIPALLGLLEETPTAERSRLKTGAVRVLGRLTNKDTGMEPGTRAVLETVMIYLTRPRPQTKRAARTLISRRVFSEAFGDLSICRRLSAEERGFFLKEGPQDVTGFAGEKGAEAFLRLVDENRTAARDRLRSELSALDKLEPVFREKLFSLLKSTQAAEVQAAAVALGQIARAEDAGRLEAAMTHENGLVRLSAMVALARMGAGGATLLERALTEGSVPTRKLVMAALTQAVDKNAYVLVLRGLDDPDPAVRQAALVLIKNLPPVLESRKKSLVKSAKRKLKREENPEVRLALDLL